MKKKPLKIENIPAIIWGERSDSVYIYVHGKLSGKEEAQGFADIAERKSLQVLSFDLPEHGERTNEGYPCTVWNGVRDLDIIGKYTGQNWSNICLYGNSLGAYFSLLAYKDFQLKKCLFLSPVLDMEHLIQNIMKRSDITEQELLEKRQIATPMGETLYWDYYCYVRENPINKWNVPTAILCGSDDNITEQEIFKSFSQRFNCDLTVMKGGKHWFHTKQQTVVLCKWLDEHI